MKIYLLRHGETTGDVEDRYGGDYDDHLTEKGQRQSLALAKKLRGKGIEKIFSSPRFRAKETAEILGKYLKVNVDIVDDIRERNFYGILTGMKKAEAKKAYPHLVAQLDRFESTIKGAEPYEHFRQRVLQAFAQITTSGCGTSAVVAHGGPISCIFRELLKKEFAKMGDCAYFEIEAERGKMRLLAMENAELNQML